MSSSLLDAAPESERSFSAWGVSLIFHLSAIALLLLTVQPWPQGGDSDGDGTMGVVLNDSDDAGPLRNGDEGQSDDWRGPQPAVEPPPLISLPPPQASVTQLSQEPLRTVPARLAAAPVGEANNEKPNTTRTSGGAGRSGTLGGTGYATTSVFGVEGQGNKFIYVFDRSASMEGPPLAAAKRQLLESLNSLDSVNQFHIIFFNSRTSAFKSDGTGRRLAFGSDRNKQLAANFVGGITADGGTDRMVALREALAYSPSVIFFLSDADDPMSASEMAEVQRLNRRAQAAICVIEFGRKASPTPDNFLMQLARESGGKYGYVDTTTLTRDGKTSR